MDVFGNPGVCRIAVVGSEPFVGAAPGADSDGESRLYPLEVVADVSFAHIRRVAFHDFDFVADIGKVAFAIFGPVVL